MKLSRIVFTFVCLGALYAAQSSTPPADEVEKAPVGDETAQPAPTPVMPPAATAPTAVAAPQDVAAQGAGNSALPPTRRNLPADAGAPPVSKVTSTYVIGPLDVLYIRVWNQPNVSGIYPVSPDGTISMPLVKVIKADGFSIPQLEAEVTKRLNEFINNPEVSIDVSKINSKSVLMIGAIGHPGKFPLVEKTTVLDAIVGSGGVTGFGKSTKIYILRGGKKIMFNYKEVIQGKHPEQNIELQNGDEIVVPE